MSLCNVKFIFIDVGGVLIKDFSCSDKWDELKNGLGVTEALSEKYESLWNQHSKSYCIDYDVDQLVPVYRSELGLDISENYSLLQDFVDRFDLNPGIWSLVEKLSVKYPLGLLTNMYPRMLPKIYERELISYNQWKVTVDSSLVKLQKPEPEIYAYATEQSGVQPSEILFIDNSNENIQAAKDCGWQTYLYDSCNYEASNVKLSELVISLQV